MSLSIGLDLGEHLGWAAGPFKDGSLLSGSKHFPKGEHEGERFARFGEWINGIIWTYRPKTVFYERVDFIVTHNGRPNVKQAFLWGGMAAILQAACYGHDQTPIEGIGVSQLKKFASGSGRMQKTGLLALAQREWPTLGVQTHDEADALWCWALGRHWEKYPELKPKPAIEKRRAKRKFDRKVQQQLKLG